MRRLLPLVIALAACGKTHSLTDAGSGDGNGVDASSGIDADAHGTVTVTVYAQDGTMTPVPDVPVVFVEPDGTIEATVPTDANGVARANVLAGASITAVYPVDTFTHHQIESVLGVKPGDSIAIGPLGAPSHATTTGTFTANVPDDGASSYTVYGPCTPGAANAVGSGAPTPVTLDMYDDCKESSMDLVAIASGGSGAFASVAKSGVAYTDGGSASMGTGWQPLQTVTATYTNVSIGDVLQIGLLDHVPDANGYFRSSYVTSSGTTIASVPMPGAAHALIDTQLFPDSDGRQDVYEVVDGTATTYGFDVTTQLLPWLSIPDLDVANRKITVTLSGTSTLTPDLYDTYVDYSRASGDSYEWEVQGPTPGDMPLPPLPTALADDDPLATDHIDYTWGEILDADAITSYDQIRGVLFTAYGAYFNGRGTTGRLRTSEDNLNLGFTSHARRTPR